MKNLKMKAATFEALPNRVTLNITYGTSRGKDTYGYNLVTIKELLNDTRYQECGGGYDQLGSALGQFIKDYFTGALVQLSGHFKDFSGLSQHSNGYIGVDGACGFDCMVKVLTDLLGYEVTYEYKRDRQGRPVHKTAITLNKKVLPVNVTLYTESQVLQKPVFNISKEYKYVSELYFQYNPTDEKQIAYYIKKNPQGTHIALRGHSNSWYLVKVPKKQINKVLFEGN